MTTDLDALFNEDQLSLVVDPTDWSNLLEENANRPAAPVRKEIPDGVHTVRIKEAVLKPANDKFDAQIGVTIEFPEYNSLDWDNLPTNDKHNQLWRTRVFLSRLAGDDSWKDPANHANLLSRAAGATAEVELKRNTGKEGKVFKNFRWNKIEALPF